MVQYAGTAEIVQLDGERVASARVADQLLTHIDPDFALQVGQTYLLRLANGSEQAIVISSIKKIVRGMRYVGEAARFKPTRLGP